MDYTETIPRGKNNTMKTFRNLTIKEIDHKRITWKCDAMRKYCTTKEIQVRMSEPGSTRGWMRQRP